MTFCVRIVIMIFTSLAILSCASQQRPLRPTADLTAETWQHRVITHDNIWKQGADAWFLTGNPEPSEKINRNLPESDALSTMMVKVSDFTHIKVNGAFKVQIFGTYDHNSLYLYGANEGVRSIAVTVHGDTLYLQQTQFVPHMDRVIVRIGMRKLDHITQSGCGLIESIQTQSDHLSITATPMSSGNIYLSGNVNLQSVTQMGSGDINVFALGFKTNNLVIKSYARGGAVNISGMRIGVSSITHSGWGDINIIGASSHGLRINTVGKGKIGIQGEVNITRIKACNDTCVYAYPVNSDILNVTLFDRAKVGLGGYAQDLYVQTYGMSQFLGRSLCVQNVYARAYDYSHININANKKVFASANDNSSIYFFGPTTLLAQFSDDNGKIIPMGERNWCNFSSEYRPYSYTMSHKGETFLYSDKKKISGRERYRGRSRRAASYIK